MTRILAGPVDLSAVIRPGANPYRTRPYVPVSVRKWRHPCQPHDTRVYRRISEGLPALRACHIELVFAGEGDASLRPGPYLRLCEEVGRPGPMIRVDTPDEARRIGQALCRCRAGDAEACAEVPHETL